MADDEYLLSLLLAAPPNQARATLLLAAVHFLLLKGVEHPLARWYPSVVSTDSDSSSSDNSEGAADLFRSFCQDQHTTLTALIKEGRTQTNDVRRAAALVMGLQEVARINHSDLALIELGASAGLNLLYEHYGYRFGRTSLGNSNSQVVVSVSVDDAIESRVKSVVPGCVSATGIDLAPIDLSSVEQVLWLRSFVWPELSADAARLMAAIKIARDAPPEVMRGSAKQLHHVVNSVPDGVLPVIFHSTLLTYLDRSQRSTFFDTLSELGSTRPLAWIALESPGLLAARNGVDLGLPNSVNSTFALTATVWSGGRRSITPIAQVDPYGRWMRSIMSQTP